MDTNMAHATIHDLQLKIRRLQRELGYFAAQRARPTERPNNQAIRASHPPVRLSRLQAELACRIR